MNETPFFMTRMGHTYYIQTLPEIARQLQRLNDLLERLVVRLEQNEDGDADA